jgi:hypothetical protein
LQIFRSGFSGFAGHFEVVSGHLKRCARSFITFWVTSLFRACLKTLKPTPKKRKVVKFGVSNPLNTPKALKTVHPRKHTTVQRSLSL